MKTATKNTMLFDFITDKEKNTITIRKEFAAVRQLVWDYHTKKELLDQWFAPEPFTTKTKSMDFRDGGHWLYVMIDPSNGTEYGGRWDYLKINPIEGYTLMDGFTNDKGELNTDLPRAKWDVYFEDHGETSIVQTIVKYNSLSELETVLDMGMEKGMKLTVGKLDELLRTLKK
jgi:uncharacterized protein YndB with AHSA1/START domain